MDEHEDYDFIYRVFTEIMYAAFTPEERAVFERIEEAYA